MITCKFESGNKTSLRHVTVKALTLNDKNEVLLVRRAPHLIRGNKFDLPGGFLERDENMQEAALRELFEETCIKGKIKFLFRVNDNPRRPNEDRQNIDVIYIVEAISGRLKTDHESLSAGWFKREELPQEEDFAFDHRYSILRYFDYLDKPFSVPMIG